MLWTEQNKKSLRNQQLEDISGELQYTVRYRKNRITSVPWMSNVCKTLFLIWDHCISGVVKKVSPHYVM